MDETSGLLNAIRAGDRQAFDALVERQGKRLYAVAWQTTGDAVLAEDVVQETFLRIVQGRSPFLGRGSGRAWLTRVVTSAALDTLRKREVRTRKEEERGMLEPPHQEPPGAALLREEEGRLVSQGFQALPADMRAALWLHVVEGDGLREVAACLGTTRSTVHRRVHAALSRLRQYLEHRGFSLALAVPLGEVLRGLPPPEPTPGFLERLAALKPLPSTPGLEPALEALEEEGSARPRGARPARELLSSPSRALSLSASAVLLVTLIIAGVSFGWFGPSPKGKDPAARSFRPAPRFASRPRRGRPPARPEARPAASTEPAHAFRVEGRMVNPEGIPLEGCEVRAYPDFAGLDAQDLLDHWGFVDLLAEVVSGRRALAAARTGPGGTFSLTLGEPGHILLHAVHPGESPAASATVGVEVGEPQPAVEIVVQPGEGLSGQVRREEGPLEGARVALIPAPRAPPDRDFTSHDLLRLLEEFVPAGAVTDHDGRFQVRGLVRKGDGECLLLASRDGYCSSRVRWKPHGRPLAVKLPVAEPIPGRILVLPEAAGVSGARLLAFAGSLEGEGWFSTAVSGAGGGFLLQGSTAEPFRVLAKLPGRLQPAAVEWHPQEDSLPLVIKVRGGGGLRAGSAWSVQESRCAAGASWSGPGPERS